MASHLSTMFDLIRFFDVVERGWCWYVPVISMLLPLIYSTVTQVKLHRSGGRWSLLDVRCTSICLVKILIANDLSCCQLVSSDDDRKNPPLSESLQPGSCTVGNTICTDHHSCDHFPSTIFTGNCDFCSVGHHSCDPWGMSNNPF